MDSITTDQAKLLLRVADGSATDDDFESYATLLQTNSVFAEAARNIHSEEVLDNQFQTESEQ